MGMQAFDGRLLQHTGRGAAPAGCALGRIDLPDVGLAAPPGEPEADQASHGGKRRASEGRAEEITAGLLSLVVHGFHRSPGMVSGFGFQVSGPGVQCSAFSLVADPRSGQSDHV